MDNPRRRHRGHRRHRTRFNPFGLKKLIPGGTLGKIVKTGLAVGIGYAAYWATEWGIGQLDFLSSLDAKWQGAILAGVGAALGFGVYTYFGKSWILALAAAAFPVYYGVQRIREALAFPAPKGAASPSTKGIGAHVSPEEAQSLPIGTVVRDEGTGDTYTVAADNFIGDGSVGISTPLAMVQAAGLGSIGISTPLAIIPN